MKKKIILLMLLCLILTIVIMFEWLYGVKVQKQLLEPANVSSQQVLNEEMPDIELNQQAETSYMDLVNRPLFIQGRKPVAEAEITQEQQLVSNNFDWRLTGIYTTKKGLMALFTRTTATAVQVRGSATAKTPAADKYRKVIVGDTIDGWKVTDIHLYEVIFKQGDAEKKLPLRKPKTKAKISQNATISPDSEAVQPTTPIQTISEDDENADN